MKFQSLLEQLRVSPEYSTYIVPRDNVVVLYNRRRPLLLQGQDNITLFQLIEQNLPVQDLPKPPARLQHLVLLAIQLIEQKVLILTTEPADVDLSPVHGKPVMSRPGAHSE